MSQPEFLIPDWPAPAMVKAACSTRAGGESRDEYAGLNLGAHVGDQPDAVAGNRARLRQALDLPAEPVWLNQVHGTTVAVGPRLAPGVNADAAVTERPGEVLAVLTADCLPVIFATRDGQRIGVAHAGWRGLAAGVLERTVEALGGGSLLAWLGPAIGLAHFEVGEEVRHAFVTQDRAAATAFIPGRSGGKWMADIYALARLRLEAAGVEAVFGGGRDTFADSQRFYSYRRDGRTGRMATLIWRDPTDM